MKRSLLLILTLVLAVVFVFPCQAYAADGVPFVEFINEPLGKLTVTKTVAGDAGDQNKLWNFTVTLSDTGFNGGPYETPNGSVSFTNGTAKFQLKHGQTVTFDKLPTGVTYTVTEQEEGQDGYKTQKSGDTGTISIEGEATAMFINSKYADIKLPQTGGPGPVPLFLFSLFSCAVGVSVILAAGKHRKRGAKAGK